MKAGDVVIYSGTDDPSHMNPEGEVVQSVRGNFAYVRYSLLHKSELRVIGDLPFFQKRAKEVADWFVHCETVRTDYYAPIRKTEVTQSALFILQRTHDLLDRLFPDWNRDTVSDQ